MEIDKLIDISNVELGGIPCLYGKPNFRDDNPSTVILYHGWHSKKERNHFFAKILAYHGYRVIAPDLIHHGDRGILAYDNKRVLKKYFWEIVFQSMREFGGLMKDSVEKLEIEPDKIAIIGSSLGGFIGSGVFAHNKNIKALININGANAWEKVEELWKDLEGTGLANIRQKKTIKEYDPLRNRDDSVPRPILLLHGDKDTQIPVETQRYFYKEMEGTYRNTPEKLKLIEVPGLNHHKTLGMIEDAVNWLDMWL